MRALLSLLAYWRLRWAERKERRADRTGVEPIHVYQRLKQLQERAHR